MKSSKEYYSNLGVDALSERKKKSWTKNELMYIKKEFNKNQKILDLACGYGRFTIPLAEQGYIIEGIDITPKFIKQAKKESKSKKLNIKFKVGDMTRLPYNDNSFDGIICMWSAFRELIKIKDQIKTLKEIHRVLRKEGMALIEMTLPLTKKYYLDKESGDETTVKNNIATGTIAGIEGMPQYVHNKKTLRELMNKTKIKKHKIIFDNFGGRKRLILKFWKP